MKDHAIQSYLLAISRLLERSAYYGLRTVLVFYATMDCGLSNTEAIKLYGFFAIVNYIGSFVGGILGDLILRNKLSLLVGGTLQLLGILLMLNPSVQFLYVGGSLLAFGSGIYSANILAGFARSYLYASTKLAAGFNLFYFAINLGSFLGTLMLGLLYEKTNYSVAFIACALLVMASTVIGFRFAPKYETYKVAPKKSLPVGITSVIVASVVCAVFWMIYELAAAQIVPFYLQLQIKHQIGLNSILAFTSFALIAFLIVGFFVWTYIRISEWIKLGMGFVFAAMAIAVLWFATFTNPDNSLYGTIISFNILYALAELLVVPTALTISAQYVHPKYLAIVYGATLLFNFLVSFFTYGLFDVENKFSQPLVLKISIAVLLVLAALLGLLRHKLPLPQQNVVQEEEDDTNQSPDLLDA